MKFPKRVYFQIVALFLICSLLAVPCSAAGNTMYGIGFVNTNALNLRSQPSTSSTILDVAPRNECVVIISKNGDWYHVNYDLQEGYMHSAYLDVLTKENAELGYGSVIGTSVNLRSGPGTGFRSVGTASRGDRLYILGLNEGWYKVICDNTTCYIRSDYLKLTEIPYENADSPNSPKYFRRGTAIGSIPSSGSSNSGSTFTGAQIVREAQKYLGIPYVYGGASPSGFDCSGLVYYVLNSLGYKAERTPEAQYRQGTYVSKSTLQPGDLVFFSGNGSTITHVGIYCGNGQFIHSPNSRSTVSYSDLNSGYWATVYFGARRVA